MHRRTHEAFTRICYKATLCDVVLKVTYLWFCLGGFLMGGVLLVQLREQRPPLPVGVFLQQQQLSLLSLPLPQREGEQGVSVQGAAL